MLRLCVVLRFTFASQVSQSATATGAAATHARQQAKQRRRSFLVRPANKRDPYTVATHQASHRPNEGNDSNVADAGGDVDVFAAGHRRQASGVAGQRRGASVGQATKPFVSQREAFRRQGGGTSTSTAFVESGEEGGRQNVDDGDVGNPLSSASMRAAAARRGGASSLPADFYEPIRHSAKHDRAAKMRAILQQNAVSTVDITPGGEADIDYGNLPPSEYLGRDGWMTVPEASSMFQEILNKDALPSRAGMNTWSVLRHTALGDGRARAATTTETTQVHNVKADASNNDCSDVAVDEEALLHSRADSQRMWDHHNGGYRATFDSNANLATIPDAIANPRSTYALRKLYLSGLSGYLNMITPQEELRIAEEVLQLTQSDTACYVAEEARYCVNLFEHALGVPSRDPLALPMSRCPTLQAVFQRLLDLRLIPSPPNVVQISEFVGTFSGYPPHRMPQNTGPFLGLLNLVSPTVLHMRHCEHPWAPRLMMLPRSLFVVEPPCLHEYAVGYAETHQPFHNFDYATRTAKDYRIEILFATMDVENSRRLREAVAMTEYAEQRLLSSGRGEDDHMPTGHVPVDDAIHRLRNSTGAAAKEALVASVGRKPRSMPSSPSTHRATSRIAELKARHALLMERTATTRHGEGSGGQLSRHGNVQAGHRPGPRK